MADPNSTGNEDYSDEDQYEIANKYYIRDVSSMQTGTSMPLQEASAPSTSSGSQMTSNHHDSIANNNMQQMETIKVTTNIYYE